MSGMRKQVLFVQGGGEGVHDRWDNRLVDSLAAELGPAYEIRYPLMRDEADPKYAEWKLAIWKELAALEDGAVVVGHSVGGTILVHALAERPPQSVLAAICLIAPPFIGRGGWKADDIEPRLDLAARLPRGVPIFLYHGSNDEIVPAAHVELYAQLLPRAQVRRLVRRDHQLDDRLTEVATDIRRVVERTRADEPRRPADRQPPARSGDSHV